MKGINRYLRKLALFRRRIRVPFEQLFERFRTVLDRNNRSLEIMTEMGDVLGGDYLFDIQYVRTASGELSRALTGSLDAFDELTGCRYPELRKVYETIDRGIRTAIEAAEPRAVEYVLFFDGITHDRAPAVGNKIGRLAEIRNDLGLPVPEGFVITTRAVEAYLRHNRVYERLKHAPGDGALPEPLLDELHELVLHGTMPTDLAVVLERSIGKLRSRCGGDRALSVRSSANEEDGVLSFAGQFRTVLNVPLELGAVERAFRKVAASLFTSNTAFYQEQQGIAFGSVKMAVGCMVMADAEASGVLYTRDPGGNPGRMLISAAWGLGPSVVEGTVDADHYTVARDGRTEIIDERIGRKETMVAPAAGGGVVTLPTQPARQGIRCLEPPQVFELVRLAKLLEAHFHAAQDIEWAIDATGALFILQSRPLRIDAPGNDERTKTLPEGNVLLRDKGLVVQKGVAGGKVFIVENMQDLDSVPEGAVLVARHDSPDFVRVMPRIAAIVTDRGAVASHMATLSRELRVPTIVNTGDATMLLRAGTDVTVKADASGSTISEGIMSGVLAGAAARPSMDDLLEFRKKRLLLRSIAPLNLIDPLRDDFTPAKCRTIHDVLRFIHERSVAELIEAAGYGLKSGRTIRLDLPVPAGILVIDIGGGLTVRDTESAKPEEVSSLPLRSVIAGMTRPGLWRSDAVPLSAGDFLSSMLRVPDPVFDNAAHVGSNIAVVSREYMNLSLKFGYHFAIVDCYCSTTVRNNHLYFRFTGGATDISKRSRRLRVIERVLTGLGLHVKTRGDLLIARLANHPRDEMLEILDQIGKLLAYTRQLDAELPDDAAVERSVEKFIGTNSVHDRENTASFHRS